MASKRNRPINLPAPYFKRIWLDPTRIANREAYPFCLPLLHDDFELSFHKAITIIVGENGTGKSTLLEGIAVLAGYDEAGGGKGYMTVDHAWALKNGGPIVQRVEGDGYPNHQGRFARRAFSRCPIPGRMARNIQWEASADCLSIPTLRLLSFFEERATEGHLHLDEPEAALSPRARRVF